MSKSYYSIFKCVRYLNLESLEIEREVLFLNRGKKMKAFIYHIKLRVTSKQTIEA